MPRQKTLWLAVIVLALIAVILWILSKRPPVPSPAYDDSFTIEILESSDPQHPILLVKNKCTVYTDRGRNLQLVLENKTGFDLTADLDVYRLKTVEESDDVKRARKEKQPKSICEPKDGSSPWKNRPAPMDRPTRLDCVVAANAIDDVENTDRIPDCDEDDTRGIKSRCFFYTLTVRGKRPDGSPINETLDPWIKIGRRP
jgi:hypothetical protein